MRPARPKRRPSANCCPASSAKPLPILLYLHLGSALLWVVVFVAQSLGAGRARARGDAGLEPRRALSRLVALEHVLLCLALGSGLWLMGVQGLGPSAARWLALKLGLVLFLLLPMEAMHAFIAHVWTARGLRRTQAPPFDKELSRGLGVEEMLRTLAVPLFGLGVPLILWLSFRKPF